MSGLPRKLDHNNHEHWIALARWRAGRVKGRGGWVDADDIEGFILLKMVINPPSSPQEMHISAKWAVTDWFRHRFGRTEAGTGPGPKHEIESTLSIDEEVRGMDGVALGDTIIDPSPGIDSKIFGEYIIEALPMLFPGRDLEIVRYLLSGHSQREIGEILGVSESRVNQIVRQKIQPKISALIDLDMGWV